MTHELQLQGELTETDVLNTTEITVVAFVDPCLHRASTAEKASVFTTVI